MNIKEFKTRFNQSFFEYLQLKIEESEAILGEKNHYVSYVLEICKEGKRLRPFNTQIFYHGYSGPEDNTDIKSLLISFELIHTMALIHDDWIDNGKMRRNVPTCHEKYAQDIGDKHIANSQAILVGDLCFGWAYDSFMKPIEGIDNQRHFAASKQFNTMVQQVIMGQMLDVDMMRGLPTTIEEVETKSYFKTASYTFVKPMLAGAHLAGVTDEQELSQIKKLGDLMGVAFQFRDDLKDMIDLHDDKDTFSDVEEGQQTIFTQYVLNHGDESQVAYLKDKMGKKLSNHEKEELTVIFSSLGAFDYGRDMITKMLDDAEEILSSLSMNSKEKTSIAETIKLLRM